METGALTTWASWLTIIRAGVSIIGVALALNRFIWSRVRLWATQRMVFFLLTPLMLYPSYMKQRRKLVPTRCWTLQRRLVPEDDRRWKSDLAARVEDELMAMANHSPSRDVDPKVRKIATYVLAKQRRLQRHLALGR